MRDNVSGHCLRAAAPGDLASLMALEQSVENAPHWSEASWQQVLAASVDDANSPSGALQRKVLVAEVDAVVVGFVALQLVTGVAEIESLAVSAQHRRSGIGLALCRDGIAWAQSQLSQAIELEVRASNTAAIALYQCLGFEVQGRRPGYYRGPVEDAVLMTRTL